MVDLIQRIEADCITLFPNSRVNEFVPFFEESFAYGEINTPTRAAMFIGQIGIECAGFKVFVENLNYTKPETLIKTWKTRFRWPLNDAEKGMEIFSDKKRNPYKYIRQPEKLANFVYGGRMGNRNEASMDGWRFRGRGPKQLTGADNYVRFTRAMKGILDIDFIKNPDLLLEPRNGMYAAAWFWKSNNLSVITDMNGPDMTVEVTKVVNGGLNKLRERTQLFSKTLSLLS